MSDAKKIDVKVAYSQEEHRKKDTPFKYIHKERKKYKANA